MEGNIMHNDDAPKPKNFFIFQLIAWILEMSLILGLCLTSLRPAAGESLAITFAVVVFLAVMVFPAVNSFLYSLATAPKKRTKPKIQDAPNKTQQRKK